MTEANFSESQLQQAVNTAYVRRVAEVQGFYPLPIVPSLIAEAELGWDAGFYFPWISYPPSVDDKGCNLFLQYKLSVELVSAGAKEWSSWNKAYYRFKIPHNEDDYHQWEQLKKLADKGYPTYYATNATLLLAVLMAAYQAGTLPENIPLLDVRLVKDQHKHVTFTPTSKQFLLHSEKEEIQKTTVAALLSSDHHGPIMSWREATDRVVDDLTGLEGEDERWGAELTRLREQTAATPEPVRSVVKWTLAASFVRRHLGAQMLWRPLRGDSAVGLPG